MTEAAGSSTPVRVDAHHHVWDLDVRPQPWTDELPALNRTFTIDELLPQLAEAGVSQTILVETINVAAETPELLSIAQQHPQVRGVVGWVDLTTPDVADQIAALRAHRGGDRLVGLRHQVQGEPDPQWLIRPDVLHGLAAVAEAGLIFELLVVAEQLPAAIDAVRATLQGRFVLAHLGKPGIAARQIEPWASDIALLAAEPHVAAKLSGLVTEATDDWTAEDLRPYTDHALAVFGPDRLMVGSDWPVCLLRASYAEVWDSYVALLDGVSGPERNAILGGTAQTWYRL